MSTTSNPSRLLVAVNHHVREIDIYFMGMRVRIHLSRPGARRLGRRSDGQGHYTIDPEQWV
jgi:hypothetical protein